MISKIQRKFTTFTRKAYRLRLFRDNTSGVAFVEFAFTLPILLSLGMLGGETANYTITHMNVSQIAMQVADSGSRVGEHDVLVDRRVTEDDVNDVLVGAENLGDRIGIFENGRVILSSLEQNEEGGQWIHWQRCRGAKNFTSSYGVEGDGETGNAFKGMGETGQLITAPDSNAVMFAEVSYDYQSLTPFNFLEGREIRYTAAFSVRDVRNLEQLFPSSTGQNSADCDTFSSDRP
ncbi:MAG: TadE family protein [Pseudomonadota bacterium]